MQWGMESISISGDETTGHHTEKKKMKFNP